MVKKNSKLDRSAKSLFIGLVICLLLIYGGDIVMPILLSGFIATILTPLANTFEKWHMPRALSSLIAVLLAFTFMLGVVTLISVKSTDIITDLDLVKKVNQLEFLNSKDSFDAEMDSRLGEYKNMVYSSFEGLKNMLFQAGEQAATSLKDAFIFLVTFPVYLFFMLMYRANIGDFALEYLKGTNIKDPQDLITDMQKVLQQYLKGLGLLILIISTLTGLGLFFLGIKHAFIIGIISGILTLIPFAGVIISALIPIIIALATKDSLWYPVGVIAVYAVVQFLEGNVITPKVVGNSININPLVVIIGLVIMGALTGIIGMILTLPILAILKVITNHYSELRPWKILMQDKE